MVSNINANRLSLAKGFVPLDQFVEDGPLSLERIDDIDSSDEEEEEGDEYADMPSLVNFEEGMRNRVKMARQEAVERVVRAAFERGGEIGRAHV